MATSSASETTPLLYERDDSVVGTAAATSVDHGAEHASYIPSAFKDEDDFLENPLRERLPYNDYTTIDWLRDLVKDSARRRQLVAARGLRGSVARLWDDCQGWVAATVIGLLTALVAFIVDINVATISDWKEGYCKSSYFANRDSCCSRSPGRTDPELLTVCDSWQPWAEMYAAKYAIYVVSAVLFAMLAGNVTMTTKANLPAISHDEDMSQGPVVGKLMYMAAGSGIPEIKTILSGFVIPHFLDFKVLVVKAIGATFAVSTGLCLGKEGPFVHISTCVGYLVSRVIPKYRDNSMKMREMLSVACSSGLSVAFGAPIGGVLFSYEEISTYFPRKVLWRAFLCSLVAAIALRQLNPMGTGKLVLFETDYGVNYEAIHYLVFILLGVCGGLFGGVFCQANFLWSKKFRKYAIVKAHPVWELCAVALVTALLQYPNKLIRDTGDIVITKLLVDCRHAASAETWICRQEASPDKLAYYAWLLEGVLVKLLLTIITFGCKVPSGIIIPALDAGALFGRLLGQFIAGASPGIFAMVGAAAFLAGVSRMTVSLAVIMFELTGEVMYVPPFMCAILTAKWVADAISSESVYDLSQNLLGHPFLDSEHALRLVRRADVRVEELIPPANTMNGITLRTGPDFRVARSTLHEKLGQLKARGLMDAGLVLVNDAGLCHGYLPEAELEYLLGLADTADEIDILAGEMAALIDRTPLSISARAPIEYAVEMFGKLGLRYMIIVEEDTAKVLGVVIKKRLVDYLDRLRGH